ncbi:CAP domain-containing protein [Streptomyces sp. NPDC046939]|uniref:CAP domain-containing protein n=1 Tax=Streptomyces sp. NPDC046939 TaxID=3155376 RepID=UPI0034100436
MGRHRRSAAGRATTGRAADSTEIYAPSAPTATFPSRAAHSLYFPDEPAPYETATHERAPYERAPYERAPYDPTPYEQAPYERAPSETSAFETSASVPSASETAAHAPYEPPEEPAPFDPYGPYAQYFQDAPSTTVFPEQREGLISSAGGSDRVPRSRSHRRAKRSGVPVRTGLLGASAAVAVGAVAVASGLIPGSDSYKLGGDHDGDKVQAAVSPSVEAQGGTDGAVDDGRSPSSAASRAPDRSAPSASRSKAAPAKPSAKPSQKPAPARTSPGDGAPTASKSAAPSTEAPAPAPQKTQEPTSAAPATPAADAAAAQVLALVNQERSKVGCSPVTADSSLAALATAFSADMAARGFFDHTDPDGATPWDRAKKAGVNGLGGENIARGQADAASVMKAWMNSPGHKANILNCDYKTLGVGVHFGSGGPWWTQDFGF